MHTTLIDAQHPPAGILCVHTLLGINALKLLDFSLAHNPVCHHPAPAVPGLSLSPSMFLSLTQFVGWHAPRLSAALAVFALLSLSHSAGSVLCYINESRIF